MQSTLPTKRIQDYRPGYPQFSALISTHESFFLCRRFPRLRARLLLLKQDKLSLLEQRLDEIDQNEVCPLFLGQSRSDKNVARSALLSEIETSLAEYDSFVERTHRFLNINAAQGREVQSLRNWVSNTGSLSREETAYLTYDKELMSLAPPGDDAMKRSENWVEDALIKFYRVFRKDSLHNISDGPNIYIYSGSMIKHLGRILVLFLTITLLLIPIIACARIDSISTRMMMIMISIMLFLAIVSWLTKSRTIDLIMAGATYTTILTVFVSQTSSS
ncbi:hypothetical protein BCIN_04g00840 [Botrytis cinerea B05.10]|uniref:DUF6594 domain-containing protein n=1 Tax=Botryotinia fuckeliana (strain B05.10) TaxID=332648 RepID=A0A384JE40_BOTFB|nr:hypothetical protein BCIN_04g00840 [Botrytis cinerea B05.10]ATZ48866.1 hypothetical protein BCIN_04g00840 [Botrytis cinerea B05.10]